MSWSIKVIGLRDVVKNYVAISSIPDGIKHVIYEICEESSVTYNGLRVEGFGHTGSGFGGIGKLEVESIHILMVPPLAMPHKPDNITLPAA